MIRYHCNEEDVITLESGEIIAISNQWAEDNLYKAIEFLQKDGFIIDKID